MSPGVAFLTRGAVGFFAVVGLLLVDEEARLVLLFVAVAFGSVTASTMPETADAASETISVMPVTMSAGISRTG